MTDQQTLYTDGGVIGPNPSTVGITWAWRLVGPDGAPLQHNVGAFLCDDVSPTLGNNFAELLAAVEGLESLPVGWRGTLASDSQNTIGRIFLGWKVKTGVPPWLLNRLRAVQQRIDLPNCRYVLLDGHPTQAQLDAGRGKRGAPVSVHNVWCDQQCTALGQQIARQRAA